MSTEQQISHAETAESLDSSIIIGRRLSSELSTHFSSFFGGGHPEEWSISAESNPFTMKNRQGKSAQDYLRDALLAYIDAAGDEADEPGRAIQYLSGITFNASTTYWNRRGNMQRLTGDITAFCFRVLMGQISVARNNTNGAVQEAVRSEIIDNHDKVTEVLEDTE